MGPIIHRVCGKLNFRDRVQCPNVPHNTIDPPTTGHDIQDSDTVSTILSSTLR